MAIFEYKCDKCKAVVDKITKYEDRMTRIPCPKCDGMLDFQDKIHMNTFRLAGDGWYETDFKK